MVLSVFDSKSAQAFSDDRKMIATRESLLSRLRHKEDVGWLEFFETYWKLIYNAARKSGLTDSEAQEVVQETMIGVSRNIPEYVYNPNVCSFKTWLMNLTRWRIIDQLRLRQTHQTLDQALNLPGEESFGSQWDQDWERNLINAAIERVKSRINPQHFQVFAFCVLQKKGHAETARVLNMMKPRVYLITHRVSKELQNEVAQLRRKTGEIQ